MKKVVGLLVLVFGVLCVTGAMAANYSSYYGVDFHNVGLPLDRVAALDKAVKMVTVQWTATHDFYTWKASNDSYNSVVATDGTSATRFLAGKTYTGVPYSMADHSFDDEDWANYVYSGLATTANMSGKYYTSAKDTTAHGIDCSYFTYTAIASAVGYENISYQPTGSMLSSSYYTELSSVDEMVPGDLFLTNGHVMMYAGMDGDRYAVLEADAGDSKCSYNTYGYSYISGYRYFRYNGFSEINTNHLPEGDVQHFSYHDGAIHIQGWTADKDTWDQKVHVHMYVGGPADPSRANVLGPNFVADQLLEENVGPYSFQQSVSMNITENTVAYIYFLDTETDQFVEKGPFDIIVHEPDTTNIDGAVQECYGLEGRIHIRGWAVDKDHWNQKVNVHMYVGSKAGTGPNVLGPDCVANQLLEDNVGSYSFETTVPVETTGETFVYIYFLDVSGTGFKEMGPYYINIPANQPPHVSGCDLIKRSDGNWRFTVAATDNVGVDHVDIHTWYNTWTSSGDVVINATKSGNIWYADVPVDFSKGTRCMDARVYDAVGNQAKCDNGENTAAAEIGQLTVSFDPGDGHCDVQTKKYEWSRAIYTYGNTTTFKSEYGELPTATLENYEFVGWYLGDKLITEESIVETTSAHTLTAHWRENVPPVISKTEFTDYSATSATFSVTATDNVGVDYVFVRVWHGDYTANMPYAESYQAIQDGDVWTAYVPLDFTDGDAWYMYAEVYDVAGNRNDSGLGGLKQLTLSFDAGEGYCNTQSKNLIYTSMTINGVRSYLTTYGELPKANWGGHSFDGWFFENGDQVTSNTLVTNSEDHTVFAHWTELTSPVITIDHGTTIGTDATATVSLPAGTKSIYIEFGMITDSGGHKLYMNDVQTVSTSSYNFSVLGLCMTQPGTYYFRTLVSKTDDDVFPDEDDANNHWVERTFEIVDTQRPEAPTVNASGTDFIYGPDQTITLTVPGAEEIAVSQGVYGYYSEKHLAGTNPTSKPGDSFQTVLWYIGRYEINVWAKMNGLWSERSQMEVVCRPPENMLTLPSDLKTIDSEALAGLESVDAVRIPASVETIADDAFIGTNCIILIPYENAMGEALDEYCSEHGLELMYE